MIQVDKPLRPSKHIVSDLLGELRLCAPGFFLRWCGRGGDVVVVDVEMVIVLKLVTGTVLDGVDLLQIKLKVSIFVDLAQNISISMSEKFSLEK